MPSDPLRHQSGSVPLLGTAFVIPKGAPVHFTKTGDWTPAGRTQTIYPWGVQVVGLAVGPFGSSGTVVSWAGTGGYWRRVSLTPDGEFVDYWPGEKERRHPG